MVKHTQTLRWQKPTNCLSVFDHFVGLALKGTLKSFSLESVCAEAYSEPSQGLDEVEDKVLRVLNVPLLWVLVF